jgi:hypothetical protein
MDRMVWTEEGSETRPLETMSFRRDLTSFHSRRKYFWRTSSLESCSSSSMSYTTIPESDLSSTVTAIRYSHRESVNGSSSGDWKRVSLCQ